MVDRQDIDALLVGALYGELTPAEEARLAAHLESHPADRSALEDLKTARAAVRESRVFEDQHEPPQAISAMLLQEAHRRAPKATPAREPVEKESWFARLARSVFAHPAMAAAAMLVLVVGVAGTLYMTKGDQFAGKEVETTESAGAPAAEPAMTPPAQPEVANGAAAGSGTGSGYVVGLADEATAAKPGSSPDTRPAEAKAERAEGAKLADKADAAEAQAELQRQEVAATKAPAHHMAQKPIAVTTPAAPMPKDLDAPRKKSAKSADAFSSVYGEADTSVNGAVGGGGATTGAAGPSGFSGAAKSAPAAPPPPPPSVAQNAPAPAPAPMAPKSDAPPSRAQQGQGNKNMDPSLLAWANDELKKTIALVKADNCREAAKHAMDIRARAPEFYRQNVAYNRELKTCAAYIGNAAEQTDERAQQKRAQPAANESVK